MLISTIIAAFIASIVPSGTDRLTLADAVESGRYCDVTGGDLPGGACTLNCPGLGDCICSGGGSKWGCACLIASTGEPVQVGGTGASPCG